MQYIIEKASSRAITFFVMDPKSKSIYGCKRTNKAIHILEILGNFGITRNLYCFHVSPHHFLWNIL